MLTRKDLRDFCKEKFVSYISEEGEVVLAENVEHLNFRTVNELIREDVNSLHRFLKINGIEVK